MAIKFIMTEKVVTGSGTYAKGTITWAEKGLSSAAVSGPYGVGMLETGLYYAMRNKLLDKPDENAYCDSKNNCWFQLLEPQFSTIRTEIGIHPDGNVLGTKGCIGLSITDTKKWYDAFFSVKNGSHTMVEVEDNTILIV